MSDDMRSRWDKSRWAAWLSEPWAETPETIEAKCREVYRGDHDGDHCWCVDCLRGVEGNFFQAHAGHCPKCAIKCAINPESKRRTA